MQQQPHSLSIYELHKKVRMGREIDNQNFKQFADWITHHASEEYPTGDEYVEFSGLDKDVVVSSLNGWLSRGMIAEVHSQKQDMTMASMVSMMRADSVLMHSFDLRMKGRVLALRLGVLGVELPTLNAKTGV